MDRQNSKKYPKILESKNTYLRIRAPEHLDIALEGLIRKVLKEQPNMDDIYTFAADYFDTLLKIREASGIKKFSTQNLCPFHYDEDADEMIKLASSFTKRGKEPKCITKMYRTLTLKDSDIRKTEKNSARTISRKDEVNNIKYDDFGNLRHKPFNESHSENEESENLTSGTIDLMNLMQDNLIPKETELNYNLDQSSFAKLNCVEKATKTASSNLIKSDDETVGNAKEINYFYEFPKNNTQLLEEKENESGIPISREKKFKNIKDSTNENNSCESEYQQNVTDLNSSHVNSTQVNEKITNEIDIDENKDDRLKINYIPIKQTQQNQELEANDKSDMLEMKKATDYSCLLINENIAEKEIKFLEDKITDVSDLSLYDTLNELNTEKTLKLDQNKNNGEKRDIYENKSLGEKLLISEPITLHTGTISDIQSFIEHEKQFSDTFKECDKAVVMSDTEFSLHEKDESELEMKKDISDPVIRESQIINEDIHKRISDSISVNEEISLNDVTEKITPVEFTLPKMRNTIEAEDENNDDQDVNSSTTSNEFEFEIYPVKDPDTLISEKQDDSDTIDEESVKDVRKSMTSKTEELIDAANKSQMIEEVESNFIQSYDLEQYKNLVEEIFKPDIVLQLDTNKSDKSRIEKENELTSGKEFRVQDVIMNEHVSGKTENKRMEIQMKSENIENYQMNDINENNSFINDNINAVDGECYDKIKYMKEVELNVEIKPVKTEYIPECQNIGNEIIQTKNNIKEIEEDVLLLSTKLEAEIKENVKKNLRSDVESDFEVVVDVGVELLEEEKELETLKLIKAATIIQSGFRRFQRKKISSRLKVLKIENITDAPSEDFTVPEEKLKSDLPVEAVTKTEMSESIDFKLSSKNADMGDKNKNLNRSATKPVLGIDSLDPTKKISLQRTKSLTTIRSVRGDFEVWNQLVLELEEAATKIQSNYRRYKSRKKLKRENAVQLTVDSTDSIESTLLTECQELNERSTGEFHDSIVLPIFPK